GRADLVERAAFRLTLPGIGGECGATFGQNRLLFQGFFLAPHTTAQALKTAVFCAAAMEELGYDVSPASCERRYDIIQTINFGAPEPLLAFCRGVQEGAPVDSFATPEPWPMPGYDCPVVMAAGAFIQGSSIELSCDAPMREPYTAYMQGGLTYESGKLGILKAVKRLLELK
ncbi:MAG: methionine gamma-lyase family protein, partial [Clostridia bacterium]|nr:methionine gamma-lyase family protein [Clostridia bacterium]